MLKRELMQPANKDKTKRGAVAVSLTQNNMHSEIALLRRKQMTVEEQVQKAPAKLDPNTSLRRLSITDKNLASYNALFALGNIRQD